MEITKWEYQQAPNYQSDSNWQKKMNELGEQGWEYCGPGSNGSGIMKRPKQPSRQNDDSYYRGR